MQPLSKTTTPTLGMTLVKEGFIVNVKYNLVYPDVGMKDLLAWHCKSKCI